MKQINLRKVLKKMSLHQNLKTLFRSQNEYFSKLSKGQSLYKLSRWGENDDAMYYEFPSRDNLKMNEKRLVMIEFESLINYLINKNITLFQRNLFEQYCPISNRDGGCGYCICIRIFDKANVGTYLGYGKGYKIINQNNLNNLIN